jgi:hexosaminidase
MRLNLLMSCAFAFCSMFASAQHEEASYQIIPLPQKVTLQQGLPFVINGQTKIVIPAGNAPMKSDAHFLASYIKESTGKTLPVIVLGKGTPTKNIIKLGIDASISQKEGYNLTVNSRQINIKGKDENGVFYGIQTLRKSIPAVATNKNIKMPAVSISDYPRFSYRGMMLDCGRHFFPVKFVKEYIDLLALHNMNYFHWHLSEDQGWRIEIKKYPKLTQIGSQRKETVIGHNTNNYDGKPYGGFYTQEEAKAIVAYAKARHITVIPEIDMPGHMLAALASYPELGCTGGPYEVGTKWGVFPDVLCIGKENTFTFIENVLSEIISIFPSKYIHIGGDEAPRTRWKTCPLCQARIKAEGITGDSKHSAEDKLQSYFMSRIEKFLNSKGRSIIGWDEILEGVVAPNATVMSWRGTKGGIEAAKLHHNVIMAPNSNVYFDYYQSTDVAHEPLAIGGYLPVRRVYELDPVSGLNDMEKQYIIGVQANLWTEYIATPQYAEYMVLPRMDALSEVQWDEPQNKDYDKFVNRLSKMINIYQRDGRTFAKHVLDINAQFTPKVDKKCIEVTLSTPGEAPIYYTLDGTKPTASSKRYTGALDINRSCTFKAVSIRPTGETNVITQDFSFNKASLCPITIKAQPVEKYAYNGAQTLNDGMIGNENYASGRWLGFNDGNDLDATIDLGSTQTISRLTTHSIINIPAFIMDASNITISVSNDNVTYNEVYNKDIPADTDLNKIQLVTHECTFNPVAARYIRVLVKSSKALPAGHYSAGKPAFLFVDELAVE